MSNNPIDKFFSGKDSESKQNIYTEESSLITLFEEQDFERIQKILENNQLTNIENILHNITKEINCSVMNTHVEINSKIPKTIKEELKRERDNIICFVSENLIKRLDDQIKALQNEKEELMKKVNNLLLLEKIKCFVICVLCIAYVLIR